MINFLKLHRGNYQVYLDNKYIGLVRIYNLLNSNRKNWTYVYPCNKYPGQPQLTSTNVYKSRKAAAQGLINEPNRTKQG